MAQVHSNGIVIEYERFGPADGETILLIHGVGAQLLRWPQSFCDALATAGFHVIRFDNRDIGLSSHMDGLPVPDLAEIIAAKRRGETPALPYTLSDMAADTIGLIDALGIEAAHIVGVSLGGMIAQTLAIEAPARVLSLAILMSDSGNADLPPSNPAALSALGTSAPDPRLDEEGYVRHSIALNRAVGSPAYPTPDVELRRLALLAARRSYNPSGPARQFAAARGGPDRRQALGRLAIPTLVIHGADDPLLTVAGGEDVARHVPNAWLLVLHGMGHDMPDALTDIFVSAIGANARRSGDAQL